MEARMTHKNGKYQFTLIDSGRTIAMTDGDSPSEARRWMKQQLERLYNQGLELIADDTGDKSR